MSEETSRKRFSLFKKKQSTTDDSTESFDESCFQFELKSNNYHTCLIEASAVMKKGRYIGMPLPLKCTWYRATDEKEFVTIEGISGAFYQPNADDIGCKICVHAVPVSEIQDYLGMPAFCEVGPIQIDPEVQVSIQEILSRNQASFNTKLSGKSAVLSIEKENLTVVSGESVVFQCNLIERPPKIEIDYKTHSAFSLVSEENKIELTTEKILDRDFIVICIRTFCSKAQSIDIAEIMVKNQQLSSRLFEANRNYESVLATNSMLKEDLANRGVEIQNLHESLSTVRKELEEARELLNRVQSQNENYSSEIVFLRKDSLVYKEQCTLIESKLENQLSEEVKLKNLISETKDNLEALTKTMLCGTCKIDEGLYIIIDNLLGNHPKTKLSRTSSVYSCQEETVESDKEKSKESEIYSQQILQLKEEFSELLNKSEAEKNFYKRKAESLSVENDKLLTKLGKNPKEMNEFAMERRAFEKEKDAIVNESEKLKKRLNELENLLKVNMSKLDAEINRNFELRKIIEHKGVNTNTDYQKIVNSLTQTLTDREFELSSQKKLNKDFMNRISQLEALLSIVH